MPIFSLAVDDGRDLAGSIRSSTGLLYDRGFAGNCGAVGLSGRGPQRRGIRSLEAAGGALSGEGGCGLIPLPKSTLGGTPAHVLTPHTGKM